MHRPEEYLIELLVAALDYSAANPDRLIAFTPEASSAVTTFLVADASYALCFADFLCSRILEQLEDMEKYAGEEILVIVEWFNRILASYLSIPSRLNNRPDDLRHRLRQMLPEFVRFNEVIKDPSK